MIGLGYPLIMRIVRLAKAQNITSIADFIAARYGKSQAVAATVALIAIVGIDPLHRAAAQSGVVLARHHPRPYRRPRPARRSRCSATSRCSSRCDGGLRRAVRHAPHRRHRAPGRPDAGDRDRVDRQARRLPRRRRLRDLRACSTARWRCFAQRAATAATPPRCSPARRALEHVLRDDAALAVRHRAAAAAVPRHRGREPQRSRDPPRRLAVPALPRADQPVRGADRDRRPADVPAGRHRQRHVRARAAAARAAPICSRSSPSSAASRPRPRW